MASQKPADSCNDSCSICNDKFVYQVKRKRFDRTSIDSKLHRQPERVSDVLEHLVQFTPNRDEKSYICTSCSSKVSKYGQLLYSKEELRTVADSSTYIGKKILVTCASPRTPCRRTKKQCVRTTGTPKHTMKQFVQTTVKLQLKSKKHSSFGGYKRTASIYLSASRYSNVFKTLIKNSKAARTAFRKIMVKKVWKNTSVFTAKFRLHPWTDSLRKETLHNEILQEMIGLQMWMSGTSRKAFTRLNHLGITLGTDATRGAVDKIRQGFSKDLTEMREHLTHNNRAAVQIRRRLFDEEDEEGEGVAILDDTLPYAEESDNEDANRNNGRDEDATSLNDTIPFEDEDEVEAFLADDLQEAVMNTPAERQGLEEVNEDLMVVNEVDNEQEVPENELCLYSLVFDNVNKHLHAKQTSREKGNIMKNMVQAYAAVDRIPTMHLDDKQPTPAEVAEIPCSVFLPNEEEVKTIRLDYVQQVKEVLVDNIPCFQNLEYEDSRVHLYEQHSSRRSNLIPLGVLDKDEARIAEMVDIMEDYHQYVPGTRDENPVIIPLFGDGLSVILGSNYRVFIHPSKNGISGEFCYRLLYSQKSARSAGSLSYIRNSYRQINVKEKVSACFNEATELLRFSTTAYIVASALTFMNCASIDDIPTDLQTQQDDLLLYMSEVAEKIVEMCFQPPNTVSILNANTSQKDIYKYCVCKNDIEEDMIRCNNKKCNRGKWFHYSCKDITNDEILSEEWYCCQVCKVSQTSSEVKDDLVYEYSQMLLWRGIGDDTLLMDTHGALSLRIAKQLTWNRTVNVHGGVNRNIEMDLQMEFFNKELKESLKDAGGNISEKTMARHGEMVGVAKQLGKIMDRICISSTQYCRSRSEIKRSDDIKHLVNCLLKNDCCKRTTLARYHTGFGDISFSTSTDHPIAMRKRIEKHVKKRSKRLRLINAR
ncbi:unnamed protein product [Mytilus coruscus]|uniref:Zinc finger PHD-type domain-containing protein n=1 Tax=Mytilus coruscus TaxID=42192 RepID=A0A6J8D1A1_MYTCO|nr:unnamed protein product [Mytilus coruscus]